MAVGEYLDDFLYYSSEVKNALQSVTYYLQYLRNVANNDDSQALIEDMGQKINGMFQQLIEEDDRLEQLAEAEKTKKERKRDVELDNIKRVYFEATGEPLLLDTKDIMESVKTEMSRISADLRAYNSPAPQWNNFLSSDTNKVAAVQGLKDKLKEIKERIQQ